MKQLFKRWIPFYHNSSLQTLSWPFFLDTSKFKSRWGKEELWVFLNLWSTKRCILKKLCAASYFSTFKLWKTPLDIYEKHVNSPLVIFSYFLLSKEWLSAFHPGKNVNTRELKSVNFGKRKKNNEIKSKKSLITYQDQHCGGKAPYNFSVISGAQWFKFAKLRQNR